ncbi:MAG: PKD domain-containing protein [Terriglobales bacterium]
MLRTALIAILMLSLSTLGWAGKNVVPTTTHAAETGNNTSGASSFTTQSNGNIAPRNVSKMPVRDLLYPGATTRMYAHFMPWFGNSNHMNVGYRSDDAAQMQQQVTDMMSRGIEGAIINWYGTAFTLENAASVAMMREAETRNGQFTFAIMEDGGALKQCSQTSGCDVTQKLINDLNYAHANFQQSPAYMRLNGRPLVFFFGVEYYAVDWNRVRANVLGDPLLVQRNAGAYVAPQMNGAYGWIAPETASASDPVGLGYLDFFYGKAMIYSSQLTYGSAYPGFNDSLAPWTQNRIIPQQCGQAWLTTMARAGQFYSAGNQLPFLQLVTWNDYEEGTQIETGIDNCVSVNASVSGSQLNWTLNGAENTVSHFTVFISADGANLMPLAELPAGSRSLEVGSFDFNPGTYTLYVKAVGKPSLTNKMSGGAGFTVQTPQGVTVASPFDGANVTSPVRVAASATSGNPVTALQVYVDGVLAHQVNGAALDVSLTMQPGARLVVVKAWDAAGANFMKTMTLIVQGNKSPVAMLAITPLQATAPVTVTANAAASYDPDGTVASTVIDFGDGYVTAGVNAAHVYNSPGTYTVKVTATDNAGATSVATQSVTVAAPTKYVVIHTPGTSAGVSIKPRISATGFSNRGMQAMQIYVDGKLVYKTLGSVIDTSIHLAQGPHVLVVKGWDMLGESFYATVNVTAN